MDLLSTNSSVILGAVSAHVAFSLESSGPALLLLNWLGWWSLVVLWVVLLLVWYVCVSNGIANYCAWTYSILNRCCLGWPAVLQFVSERPVVAHTSHGPLVHAECSGIRICVVDIFEASRTTYLPPWRFWDFSNPSRKSTKCAGMLAWATGITAGLNAV